MRPVRGWVALFAACSAWAHADAPTAVVVEDLDRFNLRVSPIGLLFGVIGGAADVGIFEHVSLGPSLAVLNVQRGQVDIHVLQLGFTGSWFPMGSRFRTGPVARASVDSVLVRLTSQNGSVGRLDNWVGLMSLGYDWRRDNGLNFCLGTGLAYYLSPDREIFKPDPNSQRRLTFFAARGFQPVLEASVGWAF